MAKITETKITYIIQDDRLNVSFKFDLSDYIPKKCFAYWSTITVRWDGMVQYCCNRVNDIVGHIMDDDILKKKKEYRIKLGECERPCRLSGANRYLEQWKKDDDVFFV